MFTLVKDGDKFEQPRDGPPEITPLVALITATKRSGTTRRVVIFAEDGHGDVTVNWSAMTESEGNRLAETGLRLLRRGLRDFNH